MRLKGKGGCLWTISLNKAIVVRALSEEWQGPLARMEEMLQSLSCGLFLLISPSDLMSAML